MRHETAFSRASAIGCQMLRSSLLVLQEPVTAYRVGTNGHRAGAPVQSPAASALAALSCHGTCLTAQSHHMVLQMVVEAVGRVGVQHGFGQIEVATDGG